VRGQQVEQPQHRDGSLGVVHDPAPVIVQQTEDARRGLDSVIN